MSRDLDLKISLFLCNFSDMNKIIKVSFFNDENTVNILDQISKLDYKSDDDFLSKSESFTENSESEYLPETGSESIMSETGSESIISEHKNSKSDDSDTAKLFPTSKKLHPYIN